MKIIFIHGMNQQNYTAHRLKEHWLKVFKLGLKQLHCRVNLKRSTYTYAILWRFNDEVSIIQST